MNNAGFLRDRMLANTSEEEWDAVIRVHLKGHFAPTRHAVAHWRERSKAGDAVDARIINTSSGAGLMGSVGQGNYSAAKAGIAALTLVESAEFARYGVTANAIAPRGPHPHDRGGLRPDDGRAGRGRVRRHGARERGAARGVAGLAPTRPT